MLRFILFDLDETLYPRTNGLMQMISVRMREYIMRRYNLSREEAGTLQKHYFSHYGTTMRGLYVERQIDPQEYLKFVHDVPVEDFVRPDSKLREVLQRIAEEKVIVTNADVPHARRVLEALRISDLFTRIFDVVSFEYECKPAPAVYTRVLKALGARGEECVLIDDAARNLAPARAHGIHTVLLGGEGEADEHIESIYQVADAIARLESHEGRTQER